MRLLLYEFRPADLGQEGLVRAIELRLNGRTSRQLAARCSVGRVGGYGPARRWRLYHIVVEALNNVVKHAAATRVALQLTQADGYLHLRIVDDGQGYRPSADKGRDGIAKHPGAGSSA